MALAFFSEKPAIVWRAGKLTHLGIRNTWLFGAALPAPDQIGETNSTQGESASTDDHGKFIFLRDQLPPLYITRVALFIRLV